MKSNRASTIMSALIYAQGLLVILAVTAVVMRMPSHTEPTASIDNTIVASIADTVAQ